MHPNVLVFYFPRLLFIFGCIAKLSTWWIYVKQWLNQKAKKQARVRCKQQNVKPPVKELQIDWRTARFYVAHALSWISLRQSQVFWFFVFHFGFWCEMRIYKQYGIPAGTFQLYDVRCTNMLVGFFLCATFFSLPIRLDGFFCSFYLFAATNRLIQQWF